MIPGTWAVCGMNRLCGGYLWVLLPIAALCAAQLCPRPAVAETPAAAEVDHWVSQLGSDDYSVRKAASERLASCGCAARAALAKVAEGPDPETRYAARRLLTLIDGSEFNRRLNEFAADVDGSRGATLPGWQQFGELIGRDPAARALFVQMQREEGPLLGEIFDGAENEKPLDRRKRMARLFVQGSTISAGRVSSCSDWGGRLCGWEAVRPCCFSGRCRTPSSPTQPPCG